MKPNTIRKFRFVFFNICSSFFADFINNLNFSSHISFVSSSTIYDHCSFLSQNAISVSEIKKC
jgi:hypothetical protein